MPEFRQLQNEQNAVYTKTMIKLFSRTDRQNELTKVLAILALGFNLFHCFKRLIFTLKQHPKPGIVLNCHFQHEHLATDNRDIAN